MNAIMDKDFLTVDEIAELTSKSKATAYQIVHRLNAELAAKGYITFSGRIPTHYFRKRAGLPTPKN